VGDTIFSGVLKMKAPDFPNCQLVGTHFRGPEAKEYVSALMIGDELYIEREPSNPHDQNAIAVYSSPNGMHLGYINRSAAAWISGWLDQGERYTVTVTGFEPGAKVTYPLLNLVAAA
jgi:hypothetical protein